MAPAGLRRPADGRTTASFCHSVSRSVCCALQRTTEPWCEVMHAERSPEASSSGGTQLLRMPLPAVRKVCRSGNEEAMAYLTCNVRSRTILQGAEPSGHEEDQMNLIGRTPEKRGWGRGGGGGGNLRRIGGRSGPQPIHQHRLAAAVVQMAGPQLLLQVLLHRRTRLCFPKQGQQQL